MASISLTFITILNRRKRQKKKNPISQNKSRLAIQRSSALHRESQSSWGLSLIALREQLERGYTGGGMTESLYPLTAARAAHRLSSWQLGERNRPWIERQVAWLLLLPQRQAVQTGVSRILSLSLGFFIYKVRELDQMRCLPILKIYDSGLFSIHIYSNRSLVENYYIQMNQVSESLPTSRCFQLWMPLHDLLI